MTESKQKQTKRGFQLEDRGKVRDPGRSSEVLCLELWCRTAVELSVPFLEGMKEHRKGLAWVMTSVRKSSTES